jgi:hypothetical protein
MTTNRTDFNSTWLAEMPQNIGKTQLYDWLTYNIYDLIKEGAKVINLTDSLKKIDGQEVKYYWYENKNGVILLGAELEIKPQGLVVNGLAKNPDISGSPYAADLYEAILNDTNRSIRLISDADMSEDAFKVWVRLLQSGHKISVYNTDQPGQTFTTLATVDDLKQYFSPDDTNFRKYRFVLSESGDNYLNTRSHFNTRRMRELAGLGLED